MYVITADVRHDPNSPLVPSFLAFDTALDKAIWDDDRAEFFNSYQNAWMFVDDCVDGRVSCSFCYEVKNIKVKEIKIFDVS